MARYAAFLRGVTPMNAKMSKLVASFEAAGFTDVATVRSSGNVVFSARKANHAVLERKAEAAMENVLGRRFSTIVRPIAELRALLDDDPFARLGLAPDSKRIVTFLRAPPAPARQKLALPVVLDQARIVAVRGREALSAYLRTPGVPTFMLLIEKTFGDDVTTRTWETIEKVVAAGERA